MPREKKEPQKKVVAGTIKHLRKTKRKALSSDAKVPSYDKRQAAAPESESNPIATYAADVRVVRRHRQPPSRGVGLFTADPRKRAEQLRRHDIINRDHLRYLTNRSGPFTMPYSRIEQRYRNSDLMEEFKRLHENIAAPALPLRESPRAPVIAPRTLAIAERTERTMERKAQSHYDAKWRDARAKMQRAMEAPLVQGPVGPRTRRRIRPTHLSDRVNIANRFEL